MGRPAKLAILPEGAVQIQDRGQQTMQINGHDVTFERYTVQG